MTTPVWSTMWNEGGPSGKGYSEVETHLRCPKEDQFANVRKFGRAMTQIPDYFAVGSFMHAGRARWFAEQFSTSDETWKKIQQDIDAARAGFPLPCSEVAVSDALRYLQEYVEHWGVRERPRIVAVEHMLGPTELRQGAPATVRTARLDDFGFYPEAGDKLAIGECKTTSASIADVANQYTLHGQPYLQKLLWDRAPQGAATYGDVFGMVLDVIQKGYAGKRCQFARIVVPYYASVEAWWQRELSTALENRNAGWDAQPERRITSCTRLIGKARISCPYRDVCLHGKSGTIGMTFEDGAPVSGWQPSEGKTTAPWE